MGTHFARSTTQHIIRMHSQACYMSYQLCHIHISTAVVQSAKQKRGDGALALFPLSIHPSFSLIPTCFLSPHRHPPPLLPSHSSCPHLLYSPLLPRFCLCSCLPLSHFLSPPLSSPFNFSLSPLCSPLTPSGERPIRLHRGFAGWGCEGKPKWNAAHLLE